MTAATTFSPSGLFPGGQGEPTSQTASRPIVGRDGHIHLGGSRAFADGLHPVWLRDNCPCATCRHPQTDERLLFSAAIPRDIRPLSMEMSPAGDLQVIWNDPEGPHPSVYSATWLARHTMPVRPGPLCPPGVKLWRADSLELKRFAWDALMKTDAEVLRWCLAMIGDGVAIIEGVPSNHGEVERVASRLAHVRETGYDRLHDVRSDPKGYNVASTDVELKVHTDMPNYTNPPGIQLLHFVENEATGGETTLTDGFAVAYDIAQANPKAFQTLCETPVSFRMTSKKADIIGTSRLVTLDPHGAIDIVRFSNQLMQPVRLPADELSGFYDAYRDYSQAMVSPRYMTRFRAEPGCIVTTHNHRVLHGRARFDAQSGPRHLQLSYMDFDDVLSRARILIQTTRT